MPTPTPEERLDTLESKRKKSSIISTLQSVGIILAAIVGFSFPLNRDGVDVEHITTNAAAQAATALHDRVMADIRDEIPSSDLLKEEILEGLPKLEDNSLLSDEVVAYKKRLDTLERMAVEKDGAIASLRQEIEAIKARSPVSNVVVQPSPGTVIQSPVSTPATVVAGRDSNSRVVDQYFGVKSEPQGLEWAPFDPRLGAQLPFQKTAKGIHLIGVGPTENPGPPFPMAEATHEWVDVTAGVSRVFPQLSREIEGGHKFWGRRPKGS